MKVSTKTFALFIVFMSILKADGVTITGVIQDTINNSIKNVDVALVNLRNTVLAEEKTGRKGEFTIKDIEPDYYYLVVKYDVDESGQMETYRIKLNPQLLVELHEEILNPPPYPRLI